MSSALRTAMAMAGPARGAGAGERWLRGLCAACGVLPVVALLAWVYHLGPFALWFWWLGVPALLVLAAVWTGAGRAPSSRLRSALLAGLVGGLVGTLGYDIVRFPFMAFGIRPFAPIESYGVLVLGANVSSWWTSVAGWTYHFINGIGFGIAYASVALGRRWLWALAWAMVLETTAIVTPFAATYALAGHWDLIALAYAGHVAYGIPLGVLVQNGERLTASMNGIYPHLGLWLLGGLALAVVSWPRPAAAATGPFPMPAPGALVVHGRFLPEWLRVPPHGCATLRNTDRVAYRLPSAIGSPTLAPGQQLSVCFATPGIDRVRTSSAPYSGGFVIVDPEMHP